MSEGPCFVGMDGAQAPLDRAWRPSGERWVVPHDPNGGMTREARWQALHPTLMVLAATGGLERAATAALATAGRPVAVGHPRPARAVARATGPLAKTDALEARALAQVADVIRPTPRPLPDATPQARRTRLGRRPPLLGRRPAAPHRRAGTNASLAKDSEAHMTWRNERPAPLDDDLETRPWASPLGRANDERWQSAPGMGLGWARTGLLERPALGTRPQQQSAALVGVAPRHGDRGTLRGRRTMWGGRVHGRTGWSRGTLGATRATPWMEALYERLLTAGKVKQGALTACRHQFLAIRNAMVKHWTPWQTQEVQGEKNIQGPLDNQDSCSAPTWLRLPAAERQR